MMKPEICDAKYFGIPIIVAYTRRNERKGL